ncbi:hypothetical protein HDK77DRAFT_487112 [Phyllosticta capitalensis]
MSSQNQSDNHPGSSRDRDPPQVLVPEDMKWLMYHGLLSNDASNCGPGFIRGDRQALRDNFVCSSYSNRRVFCEHSTPETIDIPRYLYSCATLEYLGLSAKAAAYCGARYALAVADGRPRCDGEDATPFIAFAKDYLRKPSSGVLISLQLPESLITKLDKAELGHSEEDDTWAKFVWSCRSQADGFKLLPHAEQLTSNHLLKKQLIVGHMSGCSSREILEMESYRDISKEHLFCMPHSGMVGMQYFFSEWPTASHSGFEEKLVICEKTS